MTNTTATQPPHFAEPTATVSLDCLVDEFRAQLFRDREWLLKMVDERERLLIAMGCFSGFRTAELRKQRKEQGR